MRQLNRYEHSVAKAPLPVARPKGKWSMRWALFAPIPAIFLGAFIMKSHGVSPAIWGQNLILWLICTIVCWCLGRGQLTLKGARSGYLLLIVPVVILSLTFVCDDLQGVHRWLTIGPFRLHGAELVLPLFFIGLGSMPRNRFDWISFTLSIVVAGLLAFQPDVVQELAFSVAVGLLWLLQQGTRHKRMWFGSLMFAVLAAIAWQRPDPLEPVSYVEGIIELARKLSPATALDAILSLVILPLPFLVAAIKWKLEVRGYTAFGLFLYFSLVLLVTPIGAFPVLLLGYGASPIIGYFIAIGWLMVAAKDTGR